MLVRVILVDINTKMVKAWRATFEEHPEVEILEGSMLEQQVSAWVSPTNARGSMDGGLDLVIKKHLGQAIETRVQQEIKARYNGFLPVGHAVCVPSGRPIPGHLISTPTMVGSSDDVSDSLNVALACAAAFQMVHMQNARQPGSIRSVALPGLGASTGRVPVEICADLMWTAYDLFRREEFTDFGAMRQALEGELGDLGSFGSGFKPSKAAAAAAVGGAAVAAAAAKKAALEDFDDHDDEEDDEDADGDEGDGEDEDDFDDHE
jgi:O-acetyl-ADP-ribose deacetylase (regulator of RNase III)